MVRRYRHRATGAVVTADSELPATDFEQIDGEPAEKPVAEEQPAKKQRTPRTRKTAPTEG